MEITIDILTDEPYRAVCDDCNWTSMNTRHLSNAMYWWNNHKSGHEKRFFLEPISAPMKPSQVLANV